MEEGEAGRVALAIAVLTDWVARVEKRLEKLEHQAKLADMSLETHGTDLDIIHRKVFGTPYED